MLAFKTALYILTIATAFFFGFWELKLRRRLTDDASEQQPENISDYSDAFYGNKKEMRRERILKSLPREALFKMRLMAGLKVLFVVILVLEVIILQR